MEDGGKEINSTINHPTGGEEGARAAAPPPPPGFFDDWLASLSAVEGVKGSGLEISAYSAMIELKRDNFDLRAEVLPLVKADIARAKAEGRLNRLAWGTIAKRVREARAKGADVARVPAPALTDEEWQKRLSIGRLNAMWDQKWGPMPNEPGCLVPSALVQPDDGKDWKIYKPGMTVKVGDAA